MPDGVPKEFDEQLHPGRRHDQPGRPQALVKHTFLSEYLPALTNKVCSRWDSFAYVDGFAGPWQAVDEEKYADTSFGIALRAMAEAQRLQKDTRHRTIRMVAHLVEKDAAAYARLSRLAEQFSTIEVVTYHGEFETHLPTILNALEKQAFCFAFIDPKGINLDLAMLRPLLARNSSEVLINFMFDFINRFVTHPNPSIIETMNRLIPGANWRGLLDVAKAAGASPEAREDILVDGFRAGLRAAGNYDYVTSLVVQKPLADRTLYHLVFGTRSRDGLSVFRDSQIKALLAQAAVRASEKSKAKTAKTGQTDLFGGADAVQQDASSMEVANGRSRGTEFARQLVADSISGLRWSELWPSVLERFTIRRIDLGNALNDFRKSGLLDAPGWPSERHRQPSDGQFFRPIAD